MTRQENILTKLDLLRYQIENPTPKMELIKEMLANVTLEIKQEFTTPNKADPVEACKIG